MDIRRKLLPGTIVGLLVLGGTACSEENPTSEQEDISPEVDDEEGEEGTTGTS